MTTAWAKCKIVSRFGSHAILLTFRRSIDKLIDYYTEQCHKYDVIFECDTQPTAVHRDEEFNVIGIALKDSFGSLCMACTNVVLAAGPFTPKLFAYLFPRSTIELHEHRISCDWFHMTVESPVEFTDPAVRLETGLELEGFHAVTAFPRPGAGQNGVIEVSAMLSDISDLEEDPASSEPLAEPPSEASDAVRSEVAHMFPQGPYNFPTRGYGPRPVERTPGGSCIIGFGEGLAPTMMRVPASGLGDVATAAQDERPSGVWLCYGFGYWGTTCAPAVARLMTALMWGQTNERDLGFTHEELGNYRVPPYPPPVAPRPGTPPPGTPPLPRSEALSSPQREPVRRRRTSSGRWTRFDV